MDKSSLRSFGRSRHQGVKSWMTDTIENSSQTDKSFPAPLFKTQRGFGIIVDGYTFIKRYSSNTGTVTWQCQYCNVRCKTTSNRVVVSEPESHRHKTHELPMTIPEPEPEPEPVLEMHTLSIKSAVQSAMCYGHAI